MKNRGFKFFLTTLFISALAIVGAYYFIFSKNNVAWKENTNPAVTTSTASASSSILFSALDGLPVSSADEVSPQVVGVMIDNHPDARPQSGITAAKIVYEAPAEGGITRYFALFDSSQDVAKVGPVRSARPYFIDWLEEYSGMYMHCGGSPDGLAKIQADQVFDMDEMKNGQYFWRDDSRIAPHNLYTKSDFWNKALAKNTNKQNKFSTGWKFGDKSNSLNSVVSSVEIDYLQDYVVNWKYDVTNKNYNRFINDQQMTSDGVAVNADNVIVQYVKSKAVDDYGRLDITTAGNGSMRIMRDGISYLGNWRKENGRTRFYDSNGQELNLKPGTTWIQIIPDNIKIKITT